MNHTMRATLWCDSLCLPNENGCIYIIAAIQLNYCGYLELCNNNIAIVDSHNKFPIVNSFPPAFSVYIKLYIHAL